MAFPFLNIQNGNAISFAEVPRPLFSGVLQIDDARLGAAKLVFQFTMVSTLFTIMSVPYDAVINAHAVDVMHIFIR